MARFGLLGRLLLILLSALVIYGAASMLLLRWEWAHRERPSPFPRLKQFAADIDLVAAAPAALWPAILRAVGTADILVSIEDQPPSTADLVAAPRLNARLHAYARTDTAAAARVYITERDRPRDPHAPFAGSMALATFPLADGRVLVARPLVTVTGWGVLFGWPLGLWIGLSGAAVALLAVGIATRELRPLTVLTRSLERFDGRQTLPAELAAGAPDVRALAAAIGTMQLRIGLLMRERTLMVGAISHDLGTLLTRLQLRVLSLADDEARARCAADLDAMGALIGDALAYARGSDVALERQKLDLADVAATEIAEREAVGATLPIEACLSDAPVLGDRVALRRVVANLLDNAIRFGHSRLRVTARPVGDQVQLAIEDDGPGVPPAERSAILLPFHRVESSRSRETGGTGLGLAIAARIVEAHGGDISVGQSALGGALVTVCLPCARP